MPILQAGTSSQINSSSRVLRSGQQPTPDAIRNTCNRKFVPVATAPVNTYAFRYYRLYVTATPAINGTAFVELELALTSSGSDTTAGQTYTASSYYVPDAATPDKAFDDNIDTSTSFWASDFTGLPAWIKVDYGATSSNWVAINEISVTARSTLGNEAQAPRDFVFQGSDDDSTWFDLITQTGQFFSAAERKSFQVTAAPGAVVYNVSVLGSTTLAPALIRSTGKLVRGTSTPAPTLVRQAGKLVRATSTPAPTLVRQTAKPVRTTSTPVPTLARLMSKMLAASSTSAPSLIRSTAKRAQTTSTPSPRIVRQAGKLLRSSSTPAPSLAKGLQFNRIVQAIATPVPSLLVGLVYLKSLLTSTTPAPSIRKATSKRLQVSSTPRPSLKRAIAKAVRAIANVFPSLAHLLDIWNRPPPPPSTFTAQEPAAATWTPIEQSEPEFEEVAASSGTWTEIPPSSGTWN